MEKFNMRTKIFALLLTLFVAPAWAATCEVEIEGNDAMQYNVKEITVDKSCSQFTVHLKHVGKMAKAAMGHNWVLAKTSDAQSIANDSIKAGAANDYLDPKDTRIIAHTKQLGGGEEDSVTFDTSKLTEGEDYTFFCTFPGHFVVMKGKLIY